MIRLGCSITNIFAFQEYVGFTSLCLYGGRELRFHLGSVPPSLFFFFFYKFIYFFIYFWLCWVFISVQGLSLVVASGGHSSSRCASLSLSRPPLLRSTGSRRAGSVIVAHGPSRSAACGIFPDQGSNPCPLHWQANSQPLHHQGSPPPSLYYLLPTGKRRTNCKVGSLTTIWVKFVVSMSLF